MERVTSDWVDPAAKPDAVDLTEADADLSFSFTWNDAALAGETEIPQGAVLTAQAAMRIRRGEAALDYVLPLPDGITVADTEWADLNRGGRWQIEDHQIWIEMAEDTWTDGTAAIDAQVAFPFTASAPGALVFPGRSDTMNVRTPEFRFSGIGDSREIKEILAENGIVAPVVIVNFNAPGISLDDDFRVIAEAYFDEAALTVTVETGETFVILLRNPEAGPDRLTFRGADFEVRLYPSDKANLPEGAVLRAEERADTDAYAVRAAEKLSIRKRGIQFLRVFDLTILDGEKEIEPEGPVRVEIVLKTEGERVVALHFADQQPETQKKTQKRSRGAEPERRDPGVDVLTAEVTEETVSFEAESFSEFAVLGYRLETQVTASDGSTYQVTVWFGEDAQIPEDAVLAANEIAQEIDAVDGATAYETLTAQAGAVLGWDDRCITYARFFDIAILGADGREVEPAAGSAVHVEIRLADKTAAPLVVHLGEIPEVLVSENEGDTLFFDTDGFSVYGIVDAPEPVTGVGWNSPASVDDIAVLGGEGFYVRNPGGYYFTNRTYNVNASRTGIRKTKPAAQNPDEANDAVLYFFEQRGDNQFVVYCLDDSDNPLYVRQTTNSLTLTSDAGSASVFTISPFSGQANTFVVMGSGGYCWNMQGGVNGNGFAAYNNATDTNSRIQFTYYVEAEDDPYHLDGLSYGIAYHDDNVSAAAMMAEPKTVGNQSRLAGLDMLMRPDVLDNQGILLVAENSEISLWTFENVQGDQYYIKTDVDGETRYLTINGANVTLEAEPHEVNSLIRAVPGTGAYAGKWHFMVGTRSLNLPGTADSGFNSVTGTGETTWINLVEKSVLSEEDFTLYTAKKVSVSDTANVYDGQQVVLYTRIWNDATKRYEFYAVDHNGTLVRCYDNGDGIEWLGSQVNTALWELKIHYDPDGSENYFYDLKNTQYGSYLAPQISADQILSGSEIGVNLNGRKFSGNYTSIIAWDEQNYAYSGLKAENGRVVPCALSEADDFYFAVMSVQEETELSTVRTIDSTHYGITMKMMDFNNAKTGTANSPRDSVQNPFFGGDNNNPGLLSTNLENGYPTTTNVTGRPGHSLSELFSGMSDVNHLFIESIYNESGYFEYDSTSNFAHLNGDGNFTVYDQLGAIGDYATVTGSHGQFMPYNTLTPGEYCSFTNRTSVTAAELPDTYARKGERLFNIGSRSTVDYHFGMEMTASFTQTASGLDAWGHDIIFEFSGDDDFWFYVDDELVLDLGGVHSAMTGSINFRTGEVRSSRGNSNLYDIYKKNYDARGMSESEISAKLDEIFTLNENGQHVFKDYTNHSMRMFYMERGAGASNLHMRFNLAAVKPGSFLLSKQLSGTDHPDNDLIEFPYQIWYYTRDDGGTVPHLLGENPGEADGVVLRDTTFRLRHEDAYTPAGGTTPYEHVFFLKPGQTAEVNMPENTLRYYVVECGVNPSVYDEVSANGTVLTGTASGNEGRLDFRTDGDTLEHRQKVDFVNHVREGAMRSVEITKRLYDVDGVHLLHYPDNDTLFHLRLYLGTEDADDERLPLANLYSYYIKDPQGAYCRWDPAAQAFVSLGISDYATLRAYLDTLTSAQQESIVFVTSMNGAISKIPPDYTVEVRDLIVGSKYKIEERDVEIPKGYTLRLSDGYSRVDTDPDIYNGTVPYSGTLHVNETPEIEVRNQKGWGLTVEKVWTDTDFMATHDPVYFAVYLHGTDGTETFLDGTVRELPTTANSVYYFFQNLASSTPFERYLIREVELTGDYTVSPSGEVTGYTSVTPIPESAELTIGGTLTGGTYIEDGFTYTVHYEQGEMTDRNENVRTDKVTNSRPGIEFYKTDWFNAPLAGAVFTLTAEDGTTVAADTYTSADNGLITIAYLPDGVYLLTETVAPDGYVVMDQPMVLTVLDDTLTVSGLDSRFYTVTHDNPDMLATITIRDRQTRFEARKVDGKTREPLEGVHFALYLQVTDGSGMPRKDYLPMEGYEDLISGADGILPDITMDLGPGTYYLTETQTLEDYKLLAEDLCFTIGVDGTVSVSTERYEHWIEAVMDEETGEVAYTLVIENSLHIPDPVSLTVTGIKVLNGRAMKAKEFTFTLTPINVDGEAIGETLTAYNEAAEAGERSTFSFPLTYDLDDYKNALYRDGDGVAWFYYEVCELVSPNADENGYDEGRQIRYDTNRFLVVVKLAMPNDEFEVTQNSYVYDGNGVPESLQPPTHITSAKN